MTDIKIKVTDYIYSKILKGSKLLEPCLSYEKEIGIPNRFGTKLVSKRKYLFDKRNFRFLTGYLDRIKQYCSSNNLSIDIDDSIIEYLESENEPYLDGKNIREGKYSYEYDLIQAQINYQRGIVKAATGSGKTILMLGFISCYPNSKVLFLSNSHTPISQFKEKMLEHKNDINIDNIDISTIQSFYKKNPEQYRMKHDIILGDEVHEIGDLKGMYGKVLSNSLAPIRLGFTATLPDSIEKKLLLEGLFGPIIGELTIQEGLDKGVLAKPIIKLDMVPENKALSRLSWKDAYDQGVVNNRALNRMICLDAKRDLENDLTVLILVIQLDHGRNIVDMAKRLYDIDMIFVHGSTDKDVREEIRHEMIDKKTRCVVATAVFRKALDIPNLGSVINGCGGKSESMTLQLIGRGTRATDDKKEVIIRDYFNPSNQYLIKHYGYRMSLYFKEGWINQNQITEKMIRNLIYQTLEAIENGNDKDQMIDWLISKMFV